MKWHIEEDVIVIEFKSWQKCDSFTSWWHEVGEQTFFQWQEARGDYDEQDPD